MKKSFLFFVILGSLFTIGAAKPKFAPKKGEILLTYPRSGTNWTIGILQALCKRPICSVKNPSAKNRLGLNRLKFEIDHHLPVVYRSHKLNSQIKRLNQSKLHLLVTLRNFKECIVKQHQFTADQFLNAIANRENCVESYFEKLHFFDSVWKNPNTKHLIIYEEIIANPQKVVTELLTFLGESLDKVPEFFEHYDEWNQEMLASYHEQHKDKGPASNNAPVFHSKTFPKEVLREVDAIIEARYPDLWKKYLYRYKEID